MRDHSKERNIKGINFLSTLYHNQAISLPIGFELVAKTEEYLDKKTQKMKRRSPVTKNEMARMMILQAVKNQVLFRFVLFDVWFASAENLMFIKHDCEKEVICPIRSNRKIALSLEEKINGQYKTVSTLEIKPNAELEIYTEGVDFPLTLIKQVFTNEDGSIGILYLIASDKTLNYDQITTIYQKRWNVECYHKSLKQNVSLAKSPTQTEKTQTNHFFAALCGYIKLEMLKVETRNKSFCLKNKTICQCFTISFSNFARVESGSSLRVR